jgi:hypothetical protein
MERDRRLARNEALFREVNEHVSSLSDAQATNGQLHDYICECADVECTERVRMTQAEYEAARAEGNRFVVVPGHQRPSIERVVEENERYALVEKTGGGGAEATTLDPRAR